MPENSNQALAYNLRAFRAERGWSQEEFADRCGLHRTYIGAIERGERNVTLNTLNNIASALEISSAELISESRRAKNPK
ncbi:MAG: helix-turn-helix domain-containing protein [Acidobacteriaceae bacterium]